MAIINLPPTPDLNYYRQIYSEFNSFSDAVLEEHCKRFAVEQGRSTCFYDRYEFLQPTLQKFLNETNLKALEISPWDNPFLRGDNVKYFEVMNSERIKILSEGYCRNLENVPDIDFLDPTGNLGVIDEKFDIVFSSHVIEHCPDLVEHLRNVSKILNPGGVYVLIIPDKRYCFDHYNPESTFSEVIEAYANERKIPRLADVINLAYTRTHNNPVLHWLGYHGKRYGYRDAPLEPDAKAEIMGEYFFDDGKGLNREKILQLVEKYSEALDKREYISTHNWRFTPDSFGYIINILNKLNFIDLSLFRLCHTIWGRLEFIAVLEKV